MTYNSNTEDLIWKALGDSKRRRILEALAPGPKLTGDLVELLPAIGRTGVLRHIGILAEADLIRVRPEGRKRWNYLNPDPIKLVCTSWVARHIDGVASSVARLKDLAEADIKTNPMGNK